MTTSGTVIDVSDSPVLVVANAMMSDSGEYSCVADNGFTEEDAVLAQTITVNVVTGLSDYLASY